MSHHANPDIRGFGPRFALLLALAFLAPTALLALPAPAQAAVPSQLWQKCEGSFAGGNSGAGRCYVPRGIAADPASGHLFVADSGNRRINEFTVWGEFVRTWGWDVVDTGPGDDIVAPVNQFEVCVPVDGDSCKEGIDGGGAGQLVRPQGIALDSAGDLYVAEGDFSNRRVQKFDLSGSEPQFEWMLGGGVNQGPGNPGNLCTATHIAGGDTCGAATQGAGNGQFGAWLAGGFIAVDGAGTATTTDDTVYVGDVNRIQRFDTDGAYRGEIPFTGAPLPEAGTVASLAVDPASGDLYFAYDAVLSNNQPVQPNVHRLDPATGEELDTLEIPLPTALAVDAAGNVYAFGESNNHNQPPPHHEREIRRFDSAGNLIESFNAAAEGFNDSTGLATSSACAIPGHHLYVSNSTSSASFIRAYGPPPTDADLCPPPPVPPSIVDQFAAAVGAEDATLAAKINPHFWPDTAYYLQYGAADCSLGGCASKPLPPGATLTDQVTDVALPAEVSLTGLQPATTYHYRFVAESDGGGPVFGPDRTFTTYPTAPKPKVDCPNQEFRSGPGAFLPDCRAYELVSPLDKNNGDISTADGFAYDPANFQLTSPDGERVTYSSYTAFGDPKAAPFHSQLLSDRDPATGWITHSISPPRTSVPLYPALSTAATIQFKAFSEDLCHGWFIQDTDLALVPDAPPGVPSIYRRDDGECDTEGFGLITSVAPPGYSYETDAADTGYGPQVQGISADSSRTLLRADAVLTPDACTTQPGSEEGKEAYQLYLHTDTGVGNGDLRLVSVLPSGDAACLHSSGGTNQGNFGHHRGDSVDHALSADASRVYWSTNSQLALSDRYDGIGDRPGPLYLRLNPEGPQSPAGDCAGAAPGEACTSLISAAPDTRFRGADPSGDTALYTTAAALYEFDVGALASEQIAAAGVRGVLGYSTDLSRVYFVSTQALTGAQQNSEGEVAIDGQPNLYLHERDAGLTFVATLSSRDARNEVGHFALPAPIATMPEKRTSRVSPDGMHAAFTSTAPLTGYDNADAASGEPDAEVFLYDAEPGDAGELSCLSCNPSGARPQGRRVGPEIDEDWFAARLPGWEYQLYPSRALSASGDRLFFESYDPLVLRDTNGKRDVYQWERAGGESECIEEIGAELYVEAAGGCLSLISSGQSDKNSSFFDASASGSDVFFATTDDLVQQDFGLMDVYDARAGGGFPQPPAPPLPCQGDGCQGAPAGTPAGSAPGTSVFDGPPNQGRDWTSRARCPKGKRRVLRKGRARCVPRHPRRRNRAAQHNREAAR
jgi:DNA-binding beta-propeller fold protein YncE